MAIKSYIDKNGKKKYKFNLYMGIDPLTGKEKRTNRKGFNSEADAKRAIARLLSGTEKKNKKQPKFQEVYDDWIEIYKDTVKASTYQRTYDAFRLHILPCFGDFYIDKITVKHCQDWVNSKAQEIVKYKEYANYMKKVLNFSISRGYRSDNPCNYLIYPKMKAKKGKKIETIWTKEELNMFLEAVEREKSLEWFALFRLLAYTGMRRGEILALEWSDINFKGKAITISKSRKKTQAGEITGDTKTSNVRTISIDNETLRIMKEWKKLQNELIGKNKIVFTNSKCTYMTLSSPYKILMDLTEKYNLPVIDIHRFRHIHTSMLILSNSSEGALGAIMERLGHSDIKTTMNIYNHVLKEQKDEILNNFLEYIEK